ncbi:MAG: AI-2E family transporter [Marinoscillum sp.]|uniref:AI-2E family transporter n=1 Tax=Marinoscillum sp. TaxID=2024838 RepID=UPI0032F7D9D4
MTAEHKTFDISKIAYFLLALVSTVIILVYSEDYIVPFIIALIVWFIIHELRENIQQIPWMRRNCPMWLQSAIAFMVINIVILIIIELLMYSMSNLMSSLELYESNLDKTLLEVNALAGMDVTSHLYSYLEKVDLTELASSLADYVTALLGDAFLILLYVLFLLIEESIFPEKLKRLYPSDKQQRKTVRLFNKMDHNISRYLTLKTLVSLLTGLLSYFVLIAFGIDAPIFWALLIFVLNYIPTIGSLIATLFPACFAILQFGELAPFVYILISVGAIQIIVGNVIEPKVMGNSLNISSLVVILSLTIWGAIWGVMGMILSVPITVMMIVVFEEIPSLRFIAVMLSEKGELNALEED